MRSSYLILAAAMLVALQSFARGQDPVAKDEASLLAVLRSDSPAADKAMACKFLAVYGSSECVPDLARLLADEQLASWSRIALEAMPGAAADEALRKASGSLHGKLLVGVINSIGVRRDAGAVDSLVARLTDADADVASAAAVALGRIGNSTAAESLRQALAVAPVQVRSAVAEGCVLCAERLVSGGDLGKAIEIYDEVRNADVPNQKILEATRGAILARGRDGIPLLIEQLQSPDEKLFQIALSTAREIPGPEIKFWRQIGCCARPGHSWSSVGRSQRTGRCPPFSGGRGPKQVRIAAIAAAGRVGDVSCVPRSKSDST
jgi:HEAT repeat protein